jgi:hypothetical protein
MAKSCACSHSIADHDETTNGGGECLKIACECDTYTEVCLTHTFLNTASNAECEACGTKKRRRYGISEPIEVWGSLIWKRTRSQIMTKHTDSSRSTDSGVSGNAQTSESEIRLIVQAALTMTRYHVEDTGEFPNAEDLKEIVRLAISETRVRRA